VQSADSEARPLDFQSASEEEVEGGDLGRRRKWM
jgi:hypothetical protein